MISFTKSTLGDNIETNLRCCWVFFFFLLPSGLAKEANCCSYKHIQIQADDIARGCSTTRGVCECVYACVRGDAPV